MCLRRVIRNGFIFRLDIHGKREGKGREENGKEILPHLHLSLSSIHRFYPNNVKDYISIVKDYYFRLMVFLHIAYLSF